MAKRQTKTTTSLHLRPPIVTIMGHVDHGKTTLLDAIRQSRLVDAEHGGITQHTGAYQITHQGQKITFIDTPGHAAFSKMRQRGANVTDIIILVVAANDGVKPQTVESIKHIKASGVPYIVAINKADLPDASPDMVKAQLTEYEVFVEGYGGQTPVISISAKNKAGISDLLEMILLMAQMHEVAGDPQAPLNGVVIESQLDKQLGPVAAIIVKQGTLKVADTIYIDTAKHKIRAMYNDLGVKVTQATPGDPVTVVGFTQVPLVGSLVTSDPVIPPPLTPTQPLTPAVEPTSPAIEATSPQAPDHPPFNLILKADTAGTLEAVIQSALNDEITLVASGIGPIIESDILLAQSTKSLIIGFNVPAAPSARTLAKVEKVTVKRFDIIYKLIEFLEEKILTLIEPTINEEELGAADIQAVFLIRGEKIAGCQVVSGTITTNHPIHLVRQEKIIKDSKIKSLRRGKDTIKSAKQGTECGIVFQTDIDFKVGDRIKSYKILED